jgi:hypothetical protein
MDDAAIRGTIKSAFRVKYKESTPRWKAMGFEEDSTVRPWEEFTQYAGIGLAPLKEENQQVAIDVPKQGATRRINVYEYAIMIPISEAMDRFIKRGSVSIREFIKPSEMAADSIKQTNEVLAADIFGNAFTVNGTDGVPLVSTAHLLIRGGTASNHMGTASFSQSSIEAALIQGDRFPDDVGLQVGVKEGKRKLLIPPEYRFEAKRILQSEKESGGNLNNMNVLKDESLEVVVNRYLPSQTNWFIINVGEMDGLHCLTETEAEMRSFKDDKTHTKYFQAYQMKGFDFGLNWRRVQGSNF